MRLRARFIVALLIASVAGCGEDSVGRSRPVGNGASDDAITDASGDDTTQDAPEGSDAASDATAAEVADGSEAAGDVPDDTEELADGSGTSSGWPLASCLAGDTTGIAVVRGAVAEVSCSGVLVFVTLQGGDGAHLVAAPPGAAPPSPSPAVVAPWSGDLLTVGRTGDEVWICGGSSAVVVQLSECRVHLVNGDGVDGPAVAFSADGESEVALATGDRLYGLGEKTGALERLGRRHTFWNTDAYDGALGGWRPDADPLYLSIPFGTLLRDGRAWGLFFDMPQRLEMDAGAADASRWTISSAGAATNLYLLSGPDFDAVVDRYTALTGRPVMPPRWALGWHQSRWGYANSGEVEAVASRYREEGIGLDAMWLDIQHMRGFRTFTWDPVAFPSPSQLDASLERLGVRSVFIADPGIKAEPGWDVYERGLPFFLRDAAGLPVTGSVWAGPSHFADFTLPAARSWWGSELAPALEAGLDGVWLDVNEPTTFPEGGAGLSLPNETPVAGLFAGATMADAHNLYGSLEAQATFDAMLSVRPGARPFVLSRAGFAGLQRYAATWTGDAPSTWASLAQTPAMMAGLSMSGMPLSGSDIGGYSGGATPELYARWVQVGALSPFARVHVTSGVSGQEPWMFGTEVRDITREAVALRYALMPFFYALAATQHRTGSPMLRPTVWSFPQEASQLGDDAVFLIGEQLLAAPVVEAGATERRFYLPAGRWLEWRSGRIFEGGSEAVFDLRLAALPLLLREGGMVPHVAPAASEANYRGDTLEVELFAGDRDGSFDWYEDAGDGVQAPEPDDFLRDLWLLAKRGDRIVFSSEPVEGSRAPEASRRVLRFRRIDAPPLQVRVDGVLVEVLDAAAYTRAPGTAFWDADALSLEVVTDGSRAVTVEVVEAGLSLHPAPDVRVPLEVTLPAVTPSGAVYVASDAWGWTHQLLDAAPSGGLARGSIVVPRGRWFDFKFTRGGWETVEKWPGCAEASNRYGFGAPGLRRETVYGWRDVCGN